MDSFSVPGSDDVRGAVYGVDLSHQSTRDAREEIPDEDITVSDSGDSDIIFE